MVFLRWFLAINLALSILYAIVALAKKQAAGVTLFFIFLPGLGFIIYFTPIVFRNVFTMVGIDREAVLTHAFDIDRMPEHPNVSEALNIVPVEDAMAISENADKRALLLKQLKKSLHDNYKILLAAEEDEDSESAHYVAAAKMEIYRLQQARWLECRRDLEQDPGNPEHYHTACAVLAEMLASGVLSDREQSTYQKHLCHLIEKQLDSDPSIVVLTEYENYLDTLIKLERYHTAELLWNNHSDAMRSEATYNCMLKMYYQQGDRQQFEKTLTSLRNNRQIRLSSQGLEQLRYWSERLAYTA